MSFLPIMVSAALAAVSFGIYANSFALGFGVFCCLFCVCETIGFARDVVENAIYSTHKNIPMR